MPAAWFEAEVGRVLAWLEEPDAVVLTHCHMGVNRGPSLGFAVLLGLGLEPVEALRAIQAARPIAYAYYAEDAVEWWIERHGLGEEEAEAHREALATLPRAATARRRARHRRHPVRGAGRRSRIVGRVTHWLDVTSQGRRP